MEIIDITQDIIVKTSGATMNTIQQIAQWFLSKESMTHKKLQKLCYYAKAWYLAIYDENIISEEFEAWVHGAVQPLLYQKYRSYGFQFIPQLIISDEIIPEEFISFANQIFDSYGHLSGDDLERLNHQEEPWKKARQGLKPWQSSNNIISEDDMKDYYRSLMQ